MKVCKALLAVLIVFWAMPGTWSAQAEEEVSVQARYAGAADLQTMQVLYEKNAEAKLYPASLTKVLTALTAMERISDLDETITITAAMLEGLEDGTYSIAGFLLGEEVTVRDLLYGVLLPSGADACQALAIALFGSEEAMVEAMNETASSIGMTHSHFTNTVGMHDADHYTSVSDLFLLMKQAWQNDTLHTIMSTASYTTSSSYYHGEGLRLENSWVAQFAYDELENRYVLGGKTGYTPEAGYCLASVCEIQGREVIVIIAGVPDEAGSGQAVEDVDSLCAMIDETMRPQMLLEAGTEADVLDLRHTFHEPLPICSDIDVTAWIRTDSEAEAVLSVRPAVDQAPVSEGEEIAAIEVTLGDALLISLPVLAQEDIAADTAAVIIDTIQDVMMPWGFLFCVGAGAALLFVRHGRSKDKKKEGI
ncbi:MAG TPA: serine hydrolase [Candidatus Merdibacter merdavium]|uniref:Serine hydrolase n=1 Tax=Candidatus Merdibacter merdavium TaxID=2838692 RepID=A0A9D2SUG8_9FIRM|nr:serine hydrolase [Candidatus Merdibacter merdavium]